MPTTCSRKRGYGRLAVRRAPELQEILAALGDDVELPDRPATKLTDRRACRLARPLRGLQPRQAGRRARLEPPKLRSYLEQADAYPITDYLPVLDPMPEGMALNRSWEDTTRGRVNAMARDDDTDYTILGLHVLEEHGSGFTTATVGRRVAAAPARSRRPTRPSGRPTAT